MGAEQWPDQKSMQITGAISFERDLFVTTFSSRECWLSKVSGLSPYFSVRLPGRQRT